VTIAKRPFWLGRDGETYKADLGILENRIFLSEGLDSILVICPTEQIAQAFRFWRRKEGSAIAFNLP
jgi:hypothetical protein